MLQTGSAGVLWLMYSRATVTQSAGEITLSFTGGREMAKGVLINLRDLVQAARPRKNV